MCDEFNNCNETAIIEKLKKQLKAKQKTIDALMDNAERRTAEQPSGLELLSQNLNLERIVEQKTQTLEQQSKVLKEALQELQLTQTQLLQAQKLESIGQLASGIAHEINTPLQFVSTNMVFLQESFQDIKGILTIFESLLGAIRQKRPLEALVQDAENTLEITDWGYLNDEISEALIQSQSGIKRIATIVQAMKEFSHPGSKEKRLFDLNSIIRSTITITAHEWKHCADIETHLDDNLPQVFCLADEIGQVILNILVNATYAIKEKYRDEKTKGFIIITTNRLSELVEITIKDSGMGIPNEFQHKIFDPFFTTKDVGKGTGQGLAICYDVIVKKHQGTLDFISQTNEGTTFLIQLPIKSEK